MSKALITREEAGRIIAKQLVEKTVSPEYVGEGYTKCEFTKDAGQSYGRVELRQLLDKIYGPREKNQPYKVDFSLQGEDEL